MARKSIYVSDFTAKEIGDDKQSATITIKFGDGRRGIVVADAHIDDPIIGQIGAAGRHRHGGVVVRRLRAKQSSGPLERSRWLGALRRSRERPPPRQNGLSR
jgi:hypothetical protein